MNHDIVANSSFTWILTSARSISLRISQLNTNTIIAKAIRISRTQKAMRKQFHFKHCNEMLLFLIAHRNRRFSKISSMIERRIHSMILRVTKIFCELTIVHKESKAFVIIAIRNFTLTRLIRAVKIIAARNVIIISNSRDSEGCRSSQLRFELDNCACHWYDCEAQFYIEYEKLYHIARCHAEYNFHLLRSYLLMRERSLFENVELWMIRFLTRFSSDDIASSLKVTDSDHESQEGLMLRKASSFRNWSFKRKSSCKGNTNLIN